MNLYPHQIDVLDRTKSFNRVAYYLDMGLGKTYVGSEKMLQLHESVNLVVCQKSKVQDWVEHFALNYPQIICYDLTKDILAFWNQINRQPFEPYRVVGVINYDLIFRRPELSELTDFTLMLDESSLITNPTSKRTKFILNKLKPNNVILLSGTPTSGKYELLWSQMHLLGWGISKDLYMRQYVDVDTSNGYPVVKGYKNVDRLKAKMRAYGCIFMKTEEVLDLPEQRFIERKIKPCKAYSDFNKTAYVEIDGKEFIGDTTLTKILYSRMLCGAYNDDKLEALQDIIESTNNRLIIFYNFNAELDRIKSIIPTDRPISVINGTEKDLSAYEKYDNSITLVQYQSGSMGLNLQKANVVIYFSPTLSSEQFEQSKKRIHRIGQKQNCLYYKLISGIEHRIYDVLDMRKDYTDKLFEEDTKNERFNF